MTFEFFVHQENMVVKWLFSTILNSRVRVTQKACRLKCCAASNWYSVHTGPCHKIKFLEKHRQFASQKLEIHSLCVEAIESMRSNQSGEKCRITNCRPSSVNAGSTLLCKHRPNCTTVTLPSLTRARCWKSWMWYEHSIRNSMSTWRTCKEHQAVRNSF